MRILKAHAVPVFPVEGIKMLEHVERCGRICYKSEHKIEPGSAEKFIKTYAIEKGHETMLEHASFSVLFFVDRGVSHELVRHRIASFSQESTRFCNYAGDKFDGKVTFIKPLWFPDEPDITSQLRNDLGYYQWLLSMERAEISYHGMISLGYTAQQARSVLPNSLKTEVFMTCNLREWRHFFKLRAAGTNGKPHPQMLEVTIPLLDVVKHNIPVVFDDIIPLEV